MSSDQDLDRLPRRYGGDNEGHEPPAVAVYCAPQALPNFEDPDAGPCGEGVVYHESADGSGTTQVGRECSPHSGVASVDAGGLSHEIGVNHFGEVVRWLVADEERVVPGQPLFVYRERDPTRAEYDEQRLARWEAQDEAGRLRGLLSNPLRAAWASITGARWSS
jgi:hypothetical protein